MEVKSVKKLVGTIYFLIDDNYKPIMPVYRFMLDLVSKGFSSSTSKTYAHHLKLYYEWMQLENLDYHSAVGVGSKDNQTVFRNLSKFKFWLKYPDYYHTLNTKVININDDKEIVAKRQAITINQILHAVTSFYDFLQFDEGIEKLNLYVKCRNNSQFHSRLNEMIIKHETKKKSPLMEKVPKKKIEHITKKQYKLLMDNATNPRNRIIIGLMFEGGLRVSEVIGLNISDLNMIHENVIKIVKRKDPNNPDAAVKYDSVGEVFVSKDLAKEINEFLVYTMGEIDTDYLIVNLYSKVNRYKPMKRDTIEDMLEQLGKKVGIENLHPHMLRHGLAVEMLNAKIDVEIIKDTLRHKDSNTTSSVYAKSDRKSRQETMDAFFASEEENCAPDGKSWDDLADYLLEDDKED